MTIVLPSVSILILAVAVWVVLHVDEVAKAVGYLSAGVARIWGAADRTAVKYQVEGDVNSAVDTFVEDTPGEVLEGKLKVKWVRSEEARAVLRRGEIVVCMRRSGYREQNNAAALMAFLPLAIVPRARRYVAKSTMRALDFVLAKSILVRSDLGAGVLQMFYDDHLDPALRGDQLLRKKVERADAIEINGWLTRILLPEFKRYGDRVYPSEAKAGYMLEAERFGSWLYALADRPSGVDRPLAFEGEFIRAGMIMIARRPKVEKAGLVPYLRWIDAYFNHMQLDSVYLVGADEMIDVVCEIRDVVAEDARVAEIKTYEFKYGRHFRTRIASRQNGICVAVSRKHGAAIATLAEPALTDEDIAKAVLSVAGHSESLSPEALSSVSAGEADFDDLVEGLIDDQIEDLRGATDADIASLELADSASGSHEPVRDLGDPRETLAALHEVEAYVLTWTRDRENEGRPAYASALGAALQKRFPGAQPVHERLGFRRAAEMLRKFDGVELVDPGPAMRLHLVSAEESGAAVPEKDDVVAFMDAWLAKRAHEGREPLVSAFGWALVARFPIGRPLQDVLGYPNLPSLIDDLDGFGVEGPKERAYIVRLPRAA